MPRKTLSRLRRCRKTQVKQERVRKGTHFGDFAQQVAKELGTEPDRQRFWTFAKRQNSTMR